MENKGTKTLETDRLILRQFREEDAESMFNNWASDSEVTRFLTWQPHSDINVTRELLKDWIGRYTDLSYYNWVIELKEDHTAIGNISAVKVNEKTEAVDMGYCMGKAWWGKGIMPEALRRIIAFFFEETSVKRVAACHDANNPKSGRVMEKAGMKTEGVFRSAGFNNLGVCDEVWHSIIKSDFLGKTVVRFAEKEELERVNEIRKIVNDVHVTGRPDIFKAGFNDELKNHIYDIWNAENKDIIVAERDGVICGFACVQYVDKPENPFMHERKFCAIEEFCVDEKFRRQGVGREIINFIRQDAKKRGLDRVELNMWEFNEDALAFYEAVGFKTYRRDMELRS